MQNTTVTSAPATPTLENMVTSAAKRRDGPAIKREVSPIDIDMLGPGSSNSPICIEIDSTSDEEEVDAQMDQDLSTPGDHAQSPEPQNDDHDKGKGGGGGYEGPKETVQSKVKQERYSSPLEYEEPSSAQKPKLFARSSSDSEEDDENEPAATPAAEENSIPPSLSPPPSNSEQINENEPAATPAAKNSNLPSSSPPPSPPAFWPASMVNPVPIPSEEPMDGIPKVASREPTRELSAEPLVSDKEDEPQNQPAAQSDTLPPSPGASPTADVPPAKPAVDTPAPAPSPSPPSSPSPTPDAKLAPFYDLVRPRRPQPKPKARPPPASQPAPDTRTRFSDAPARPAAKRKSFLHTPASQPAPARPSAGSSTAASQRAQTV